MSRQSLSPYIIRALAFLGFWCVPDTPNPTMPGVKIWFKSETITMETDRRQIHVVLGKKCMHVCVIASCHKWIGYVKANKSHCTNPCSKNCKWWHGNYRNDSFVETTCIWFRHGGKRRLETRMTPLTVKFSVVKSRWVVKVNITCLQEWGPNNINNSFCTNGVQITLITVLMLIHVIFASLSTVSPQLNPSFQPNK